jgi:hypothetical protein
VVSVALNFFCSLYIIVGNDRDRVDEAVSKLVFAENHPCPNPKGWDDFQRLPPLREGQEVDENHEKDGFETSSFTPVVISSIK